MEPGLKLEKYEGKPYSVSDEWSYRSVIGSVMFMANQLRPDVSFAVHHLAKFTSNPGPEHYRALVRVVKYLYHTRNKKLTYWGGEPGLCKVGKRRVEGAADSSFNDCTISERSSIGWGAWIDDVTKGDNAKKSGAIIWGATMTKSVATSSTMAEVLAACEAGKDIIWLRQLMRQLGYKQPGSSRILEDNNGCIGQAYACREVAKAKHYGRALGYLSELVNNGSIHLVKVKTDENPADMNTKALPRNTFLKHGRSFLGDAPTLNTD